MAYEISRPEILEKIENDESFEIVEISDGKSRDGFESAHLPSAVHVSYGPELEGEMLEAVPDLNKEIILYSGDGDSGILPRAAERLDHLGYGNIFIYTGGKEDWRGGDLPLVRSDDTDEGHAA